MNTQIKELILQKARAHVSKTCLDVKQEQRRVKDLMAAAEKDFQENPLSDKYAFNSFIKQSENRTKELKELKKSPYFSRCDVIYSGENRKKRLYFSKFQFSKKSIYSWVAPAATIRFSDPGEFSFQKPNGAFKKGQLLRKDQFMIVDGKIIFLATESKDVPRELIYQEHFSSHKKDFVLDEIVAQMEKAQDQVIRAHHQGPFVISGPAGSGKTTLALHRVAYLTQSPDLAQFFPAKNILILVQDELTQEYFSHLLPELGIDNVQITTFSQWAREILQLENFRTVVRYGPTEQAKDATEEQKINILKADSLKIPKFTKNIFTVLKNIYQADSELIKTLQIQRKEKILDRIDLTLLLMSFKETFGDFKTVQEHYVQLQNGRFKKKKESVALEYSLMIIDEFQNYLPEQLMILKKCAKKRLESIVYVGELAQQVRLGTVRKWKEINEEIKEERLVTLQKVYRNTKNILQFIQNLGYKIDVPKEVKEGQPVTEKIFQTKQEEITYIKSQLKAKEEVSVGILAKEREYLDEFKQEFKENENIKIFSIREAQGVEFDVVFLVGVKKDTFSAKNQERQKIQKNLLYIALTRCMNELFVLGREKLKAFAKK